MLEGRPAQELADFLLVLVNNRQHLHMGAFSAGLAAYLSATKARETDRSNMCTGQAAAETEKVPGFILQLLETALIWRHTGAVRLLTSGGTPALSGC
jgi:hypothetical protein